MSTKPTSAMGAFNIIVTHTLEEEYSAETSKELVNLTRGMVRERAVELAVMNGRQPHEASKSDWEDAKLELAANPKR